MLQIFNNPIDDDYLEHITSEFKLEIDNIIENEKALSQINFSEFTKKVCEMDPYNKYDTKKVFFHIIDYILLQDKKEFYNEVDVVEMVIFHYKNINN